MRLPQLSLACLLLAGCAGSPERKAPPSGKGPAASTTPLPGWVENVRGLPAYPISRYMLAVGSARVDGDRGTAMSEALYSGRKKISEELNSNLQAVTDLYLREVGSGDDYVNTTDYVTQVRNKTESLLLGSQGVQEFYDPASDTLYVLVVLDREQHASGLLREIDDDLARASAAADQASSAGKLRALIAEHVILEGLMPKLLNLEIALPKGHPKRGDLDQRSETAKSRLRAVLKDYNDLEVTLRVVAGNGQRGFATEALGEDIVFEATAGGGPLAGFPVAFDLEHPEHGEVTGGTAQTGRDGRFACRVAGLTLSGDEENEVYARLDYESLGETVLRAPYATAFYRLPTLQSATFSILIEETNLDAPAPESVVRNAIKSGLTERRARVIDLDAFLSAAEMKQALEASPAWLQQRLGGKVDYLIRGSARSKFNSMTRGRPFCYAGGRVEMIDIRTGVQSRPLEQPLTSTGPKASGSNEADAGNQALRKFAQLVEEEYMTRVDELFQRE